MKRRVLRITAVLMTFLAMLAVVASVPFTRDAITNAWHCRQFENAVVNLSHPANTTSADSKSRVGLLYGNGNHCDYFAGQLRTYTGDFQTIKAHYASLTFHNPIYERQESVDVEAVQLGNLPYSDIVQWQLPAKHGESYYLVYIYRNYKANSDFRCH